MEYDKAKEDVRQLIELLDSHNFLCCNSVRFTKLITLTKCLLEDLLEELSHKKE